MSETLDDFLLELRRFRDEIVERGQHLGTGTHEEVLRLIEENKSKVESTIHEPPPRNTREQSR
jgi:hypothetical protein